MKEGEKLNCIELTEKNTEMVNKIITILHDGDFTAEEAYSILYFAKERIRYTSKVEEVTNDKKLINLPHNAEISQRNGLYHR